MCMLLLFVVGGIIFASHSYAIFKRKIEGRDISLKVGNLEYTLESDQLKDYQLTVGSNSVTNFDVKITSKNSIDTKYEVYYKVIEGENSVITAGYSKNSEELPIGIIKANEEKLIKLVIMNGGTTNIKVEIGLKGGLAHNEIDLEEGEYHLLESLSQEEFTYAYTGEAQTFQAPVFGTYKIELWGAGSSKKGAYTSGIIDLDQNETLYVYVGGKPTSYAAGGYNGGGKSGTFSGSVGISGAGATDIRLKDGAWNDATSLRSRIMVAAGGCGGYGTSSTGSAGGLTGYTTIPQSPYETCTATGGTQKSGGVATKCIDTSYAGTSGGFGYAGNGGRAAGSGYGGGGGSGYYGGSGGVGAYTGGWGGGGGSSFISGHAGCIAIKSETDQTPKVSTYSKIEDSYHYSEKIFTDTVMIDGAGYKWTTTKGSKTDMPTFDGTSTMSGNDDNGYAKITLMKNLEGNETISDSRYEITGTDLQKQLLSMQPYTSKNIEITLTSKTDTEYNYELFYKIIYPKETDDLIEIGYLSESNYSSQITLAQGESKTLFLTVNNKGKEKKIIAVGAKLTLSQEEIIFKKSEHPIEKDIPYRYYTYDYKGESQEFSAKLAGPYKIELWGAGSSGKGSYTSGVINLEKDEPLYVYVGGKPTSYAAGGYNGGGKSGTFSGSVGVSGAGATDIRLKSGTWNDTTSLRSRIMVAAGGCGGSGTSSTGSAGGLTGYTTIPQSPYDTCTATGGTQKSGGTATKCIDTSYAGTSGGFGYAGNAGRAASSGYGGGGGSGYYGGSGGVGAYTGGWGGGGGSSFISGHAGCIAIKSETDQTPKVSTYSKIEDSHHYSGKIFTDTVMIDGQGYKWTTSKGSKTDMPDHNLIYSISGNIDNGYARITYIGE